MNNMKIGLRIWLGFGLVCLLLVVAVVMANLGSQVVQRDTVELLEEQRQAHTVDEWVANTQLNVTRVLAVAKSQANPAVDAFFKPQIAQTTQRINELQKTLETTIVTPEGKALFSAVGQLRTAYIDARKAYFEVLKSGDLDQADGLLTQSVLPASEAYLGKMRELAQRQHDDVKRGAVQRTAAQSERILWLDGLSVLAVLLSLWVAGLISRSITRPVRQAVEFAQGIAEGKLNQTINTHRSDELGQLLQALALMQASLSKLVASVQQSAISIEAASVEVAAGNQDLSSRTENTASSLEQTASSMEQITATVQQSADAARQANQLASTATSVAVRGGEVVGQVVSTMQDINQSSQKIADIIGVIDSIAFQTNILALNAAVEAARAGEQGRGFAVVASEVRSLAQRSAGAAKEIKALISASVDKVQTGSDLVRSAGETMGEIVSSVQRVTDIIGEISAAAGEQSNGIAQINVAVTQLDQMTQQNAALVEESAAAAQSMRDQAQHLSGVVSVFQLGEHGVMVVPPARTAHRAVPPAKAPARSLPSPKPYAPAATASLGMNKNFVANKPALKSAGALKASIKPASPALKRPALGAQTAAAKGAASAGGGTPQGARVSKASQSDDGDWESF